MPDNKCKWEPKYYPGDECREPPFDEKGLCILHSEREDKDKNDEFKKKVEERLGGKEKIDFKGCYFPEKFPTNYFRGHIFDKPVDFSEAKFSEAVDFTWATFSQKADFSLATFSRAYFIGATFSRAADFHRATFSKAAYFGWAKFAEAADFTVAVFLKDADFVRAGFSQEANFTGAKFSEVAYFSGAKFSQEANFRVATFSQAYFTGATFSQAYFTGATFSQAYFIGATFSQGADFSGATFSQKAYFGVATFSQAANFSLATFSQGADFEGATFSQGAVFLGAAFEKGVTFDWAEFMGNALFLPIEGEVEGGGKEIREVNLGDPTSFRHTRFLGEVVFQQVDLRNCSFPHSNVDKVDFRYCEFGKEKGRQNVLKDERDCIKDVKDADKGPFPYNGRVFMDTAEERRARGGYEPACRLYIELKKNFEDKKDWNTAGDFHYGEMECRRKMKEGWLWRNVLSLEAVYFWLSGYGERPLRAAVSLGLLIGICAVLYMYFEGFVGKFDGDYVRAFLKSGCDSIKITTLQRIGHVEEYDSLPAKAIFIFESIMGPILIALLALALRRKVKR